MPATPGAARGRVGWTNVEYVLCVPGDTAWAEAGEAWLVTEGPSSTVSPWGQRMCQQGGLDGGHSVSAVDSGRPDGGWGWGRHRRELGLTFRGVSGLHGPCKNERLTERKAPECSFLSGPGQREEAVVGDRRWTEASRDGSRSAAGEAPSVASARPGDRAGALRVPGDVRRKAGCKPPPLRAPSTRGDLRPQEPA